MKTTFKTPTMASVKDNAMHLVIKAQEANDKIMGKEENNRLKRRLVDMLKENPIRPDEQAVTWIKGAEKDYRKSRENNNLVTGVAAGVAGTAILLSSAAVLTKLAGCAAVGAVAYKGLEFMNTRSERNFIKDQIDIIEFCESRKRSVEDYYQKTVLTIQ